MKYIIYKMVAPDALAYVDNDLGYHPTEKRRIALERLDITGIEEEHSSMESAMTEIYAKKDKLHDFNLTVLPVFQIDYEGEIRTA